MVKFSDIEKAYEKIKGIANKTPVMTSGTLDDLLSASVYFKCENFQKTGSFKFRGAFNAVSGLTPQEKANGVITHSSGNHAQALALVSRLLNIPCVIVMPSNSSQIKIEATRGYGAQIVTCGTAPEDRGQTAKKLVEEKGYTLIHPYNNDSTIAGAGSAMYEFIKDVKDLDFVFCPIGGGGLRSGTSIAAKKLLPDIKVIGVEPKNVDDAYRSFKSGRIIPNKSINTMADGLRTSLCERTFKIIQQNIDEIVTVSEEEILKAMRFCWENMKLVIEPSGAVSLAGVMCKQKEVKDKRIGAILSGGNVELKTFFDSIQIP